MEAATKDTTPSRMSASLFAGRKVMWICALLAEGFFAIDGFFTFSIQTGRHSRRLRRRTLVSN